MTNQARAAMRLSHEDARLLKIVAEHVQRTTQTPFVSPSNTLRAALRIAAEVADSTAQAPKEAHR